MAKLRSPIPWFGGKYYMRNKIIPLFPKHHIYVEVFGGGASLLFGKDPSPVEVYNDIDSGLVDFFRVLRDPYKFARLYHLACLTPYSRKEFYHCKDTWRQTSDEVERVYKWFVVARFSFSGTFGRSISMSVNSSDRGKSSSVSRWLSILEMLPDIANRLLRVQIENVGYNICLKKYDTNDTLFYVDPPYHLDTRSGGKVYEYEFKDSDHEILVKLLLNVQGKVIFSCYLHDVYGPLLDAGWDLRTFPTTSFAAGRTRASYLQGEYSARLFQQREEAVFISPNCFEG